MARAAIKPREVSGYFPPRAVEFIPSGSALMDLILGGGYPLGRISNIVGDRSSGKTLLAIESCANFAKSFPTGLIHYIEAESAFDVDYAASLGLPIDRVTMHNEYNTVEQLFTFLEELLEGLQGEPVLCIIDSLDALSDEAELERKFNEGSFGAAKAKKLSEAFRRLVRAINKKRCHLMFISQIRDNIGVMFGKKHTRSGGKALDFYASQVVWLTELGKIKRQTHKIERVIGLDVKAKCEKNKITMPFREVELVLRFGYGMDDEQSSLKWLLKVSPGEEVDRWVKAVPAARIAGDRGVIQQLRDEISTRVRTLWQEIEANLAPEISKYP